MTEKYKESGVNIALGEAFVDFIKASNPDIGGFAGLYPLDENRYLVACTDGVGTKLELGIKHERFEGLGQDLVAMSINDLICTGAKPLFFLDYFATGKLDLNVAKRVLNGIQAACKASGCVLLGGETAEMPGFYSDNKFDLAGFAVGLVDKQDLIDGTKLVKNGDVVIGLPSDGFHATGFSLIRSLLKQNNLTLDDVPADAKQRALAPTKLYSDDFAVLKKAQITPHAMAHITGGGLTNIDRVVPKGLRTKLDNTKIPTPAGMRYFKDLGQVSDKEAFTIWNMGVGFVIVASPQDSKKILSLLNGSFCFGQIEQA